ncbi:MAG: hypothetical protein BGO55_25245 [Sphingobacteriales bacterium 50-39]|nr:DUF2961 domain-containing protein [Sphingobacteriales bacterium]OJW58585.1 MAG: hypothetical protein BGO55_25245 [Sphingobacteriales bacterium 50-39]
MMLCAQQSPSGVEAYRRWDLLPQQRIGVRAYMRSTYDRTGGGSDAGNFLFMNKEDENVTLDVKGQGMLYFFRANHWHGSPWHFTIDGKDHIVKETATDSPVNAWKTVQRAQFIPGDVFHEPMDWTWTTSKGADLIWTPMPFQDSFRIAYSRTFYGTGYYIYHLFNGEVPVSTFDPATLMSGAGTDIAPKDIATTRGQVLLDKQSVLLDALVVGPSVIRALKLKIPLDKAVDIERLRLRITWDDASYPSVDAPLCLFFGAGTFFNKGKNEYFVKGLPINIRYDYPQNKVELACYYPMPFFRQARLEIVGGAAGVPLEYEIRYEPLTTAANLSSYFHATYVDIPEPVLGQDMVWLDTKGVEGHADWSGSFAGTSFIFSHNANFFTLEGDPRFFFDDSQTPQAQGTGTEEWAGGGDYWGGEKMTLPLAGHPCGTKDKALAVNDKDLIESAYRFLMADIMPFGRRAIIRFEHSEDVSMEHYEAVTYWYGLPAPSLIKTDSLDIGKVLDENKHNYYSPDASPVETLVSRYEWGPDSLPEYVYGIDVSKIPGYKAGTELYPTSEQDGRHTLGVSEFTVRLDPANVGVLLRRTLDYSFPNQTAEVYVQTTSGWQKAGIWYLAGANTCMYSEPPDELGLREYHVRTSDRQFRDDEFLLPARLTKGQSFLRIRIRCIPDQQQLYPGHAFPKPSCWSELKYDVYSYVIPKFQIDSATTDSSDHVSVYPNPAGDQVNLEIFSSLTGVINVQVINAVGVTVKHYQYSKEEQLMRQSISLSGLPTGLYFIRMQSAGWSEIKKILK